MTGIVKNAAAGLTVALVFFLTLEGLLYLSGVEPLHERSDPYVGFAGYSPLFVEKTAEDGARVFATADNKFNWFNRQRFPVTKAAGVTRVFCLGGSTTYGRPYDDRTSFCGWLEALLPVMDPGRRWEVVNAGGISYASYRIVRVMEELAGYQPDLFVVYTGHNEFLEARTYDRLLAMPEFMRDLGSLASRLRFYTVLSDIVYPTETVLDTEIDAVLDNSVGPEDYRRDDARRDAVLEHFRLSLQRMTGIADQAGADIVFVTPASNLRDFSPFKAEPTARLDPADVRRVEGIKTAVAGHLEDGRHDRAATLADEGLALDPRDAELLFLEGRALLALGSIDEAAEAFVQARDEDVAPLRALTPVHGMVSDVASAHGAGLVDFTTMMRDVSPYRIPGNEHFLDHVHPSIESHRMLALAIADEMVEMGIADGRAPLDEATVSRIVDDVMSGVDVAAHATALANLARVLTWAGKQDEAMRLAQRATEMSRDPHTLFQMLTVLVRNDRHEEALPYSRDAARLMPDNADIRKINGIILSETGRKSEALEELRAAARLDAGTTDVHYHLGLVLSELGQTDRAARAYRTAIELQPDNADALNNLGVLLAQRGELQEAVGLFERAVQADPAHAGAARNLARARGMLGG